MSDRIFTKTRRKELLKAIHEEHNLRKAAEYISKDYMEDGKAAIHVNIDDLYNPMSLSNLRQLNGDIFSYVEESANLLPAMMPLRVIMHGVDEEDRKLAPDLFKMHYRLMMQDQFWDQRKNRTKMIYMTVIGVIFIPAYLFFALRQEDSLFLEVLSITGSFSL